MGLKDIGATLPPGFRFYPSDEELVCHYLQKKITNEEVLKGTLVEIDLHVCEPWQLPEVAKLNSNEWYFFSFRDRKYATGYRTNRATTSGYWKATGKDRMVLHPRTRAVVGMRKTLVFYKNRAPNGIKTGWIMHEFRLENPNTPPKEDWVLCRVFQKAKGENSNKLSPQNAYDEKADGGASPTTAALSPPNFNETLPYNYLHFSNFSEENPSHQAENTSNFLNLSVLDNHNDQLQLNQHDQLNVAPPNPIINPKCEDEFGFLFDMSFQESNLRDNTPPSTLENIRFGEDSSSVFF